MSVLLNGSDEYLYVENALTSYPHTVVAWVYWTGAHGSGLRSHVWMGDVDSTPAAAYTGVATSLATTDAKAFVNSPSSSVGSAGANLADGAWHMVAAIFTGATERYAYADGTIGTNPGGGLDRTANYNRVSLGAMGLTTPSNYHTGRIAHAVLFPSALSEANLDSMYNSGSGWASFAALGAIATPTAYWPLQADGKAYDGAGAEVAAYHLSSAGTGPTFSADAGNNPFLITIGASAVTKQAFHRMLRSA